MSYSNLLKKTPSEESSSEENDLYIKTSNDRDLTSQPGFLTNTSISKDNFMSSSNSSTIGIRGIKESDWKRIHGKELNGSSSNVDERGVPSPPNNTPNTSSSEASQNLQIEADDLEQDETTARLKGEEPGNSHKDLEHDVEIHHHTLTEQRSSEIESLLRNVVLRESLFESGESLAAQKRVTHKLLEKELGTYFSDREDVRDLGEDVGAVGGSSENENITENVDEKNEEIPDEQINSSESLRQRKGKRQELSDKGDPLSEAKTNELWWPFHGNEQDPSKEPIYPVVNPNSAATRPPPADKTHTPPSQIRNPAFLFGKYTYDLNGRRVLIGGENADIQPPPAPLPKAKRGLQKRHSGTNLSSQSSQTKLKPEEKKKITTSEKIKKSTLKKQHVKVETQLLTSTAVSSEENMMPPTDHKLTESKEKSIEREEVEINNTYRLSEQEVEVPDARPPESFSYKTAMMGLGLFLLTGIGYYLYKYHSSMLILRYKII